VGVFSRPPTFLYLFIRLKMKKMLIMEFAGFFPMQL